MKKKSACQFEKLVYAKVLTERHEAVFSGIGFVDFMKYTPIPIENILLLKSNYIGRKYHHNFELFEGRDEVGKLIQEVFEYKSKHGDFSFVDYADASSLNQISNEQVAELLYLAHMNEPLKSPFFEVLQNNFVYLSHDDDWYCKLYCKEWQTPIAILLGMLHKTIQESLNNNSLLMSDELVKRIYELSVKGLLVKLYVSGEKKRTVAVKLYEVGEHENMDVLFNSLEEILSQSPLAFEVAIHE